MKAKVLKDKITIDGKPVKAGEIVEVDEATCRNLILKEFVEAADAASKALDLQSGSRLSKERAQKQIDSIVAAREAAKLKAA